MKSLKWQEGKEEAWGMEDGADGCDEEGDTDEADGEADGKEDDCSEEAEPDGLSFNDNEFTQDGHTNLWEQEQESINTQQAWNHS